MKLNSLFDFANVKGGFKQGVKDTYFLRCVGCNGNYDKEIAKMDMLLADREMALQGQYLRICRLPKLVDTETVAHYTGLYERWLGEGRKMLPYCQNMVLNELLSESLNEVREQFVRATPNISETMEKNFFVKLLFWMECAAEKFLLGWSEKAVYKFIYSGELKKQEYLFLYFLTLLGIDVLILSPDGILQVDERLLALSEKFSLGELRHIELVDFDVSAYIAEAQRKKAERAAKGTKLQASPLPAVAQAPSSVVITSARQSAHQPPRRYTPQAAEQGGERQELAFEELAQFASSVVMIAIHDSKGGVVGTGSGIMISEKGYILTNHHVARGGHFYSVRIEDDQNAYETDEVIKYNSVFDLAVIRIDRPLNPLKIFQGSQGLVRGQKVVAIGSPLGLFNSVSDGIISGFRQINDVDMIQFTAPISHGSSGGALLNMYGEVIGVSTAGFDKGQNINLAVGYQYVSDFIRGFL